MEILTSEGFLGGDSPGNLQPNKWVNSGGILVAPANMKVNLDDFNFRFDCGEYWRLRYVVGCFVFVVLMYSLVWVELRPGMTQRDLSWISDWA